MSLVSELGQLLLDQAVSYMGARTQRLYYIPYEPAPAKVALIDLSETIPPEYLIVLALLGVIFIVQNIITLCYLLCSMLKCIVTWLRLALTRTPVPREPVLSELAQSITPFVAASQVRAIREHEQLHLATVTPRRIDTTSSESVSSGLNAATVLREVSQPRGRSRVASTRSSSLNESASRRVTRSSSCRPA